MAELMKGNCWHERKDAKDRKGNPIVTYPVFVEDKHDEIRCHVIVDNANPYDIRIKFLSYAGKPLANMDKFCSTFATIAKGTGWNEFDMGFECNGNFNDSYRWVRSTKGIPEDLKNAKLRFFVFGLPGFGNNMVNQLSMRQEVVKYAEAWVATPVLVPEVVLCVNPQDVENAFINARARGREGVMVKQVYATYERKRTDGWLKLKNSDTYDGKIVGFVEAVSAEGVPHGRVGSVVLQLEDGSTASPHGLGHELAAKMWQNQEEYLGQWVEFDAMEIDRQGGYRHPVFRRLRESKG